MTEQQTFQFEDGGSTPTLTLQDYHINSINHAEAKAFIEYWHYSKRMPTGKNFCFGLFWRELYAVIVYGIGVNPYQAAFLGVNTVLEIKRMARTEPKEMYPLSRFMAITLKLLRRKTEFDAIVAFADPEYGHEGTVYKASGFQHLGMTNAEWHLIDGQGVKRHRRFAYRYAKRNSCTTIKARERLGLTRAITLPKHRYVRFFKS